MELTGEGEMSLEDEKVLVAKGLGIFRKAYSINSDQVLRHDEYVDFEDWNPQDNDKATCKEWDDIWGNMDVKTAKRYMIELKKLHYIHPLMTREQFLHTTKPSISWPVLVKVILELRGE